MAEVKETIRLTNFMDKFLFQEGKLKKDEVRTLAVEALVDTGSTMLVLPQEVVEKLGLRKSRKVIVSYSDERKEERDVAGVVTVSIGDREANIDCIIGPPNSEPLIGHIVLEELDLVVNSRQRRLRPRPESPFLPLLKLKLIS